MSSATEAAAAARARAAANPAYYNLKLGPTFWTVSSGLGIEYNDNVNFQAGKQEADLIVRPQMNAAMAAVISERNTLNFTVGVGYSKYFKRTDLDRLFLTPGSELSFNVFVKEVVINLHDRFSISESTVQNPALSQNGNVSRLENILGLAANWDLNKMSMMFGYDHGNFVSLNNTLQQADGQSETVSAGLGFPLHKSSLVGIEAGASLIDYTDPRAKDGLQYNGGFFYNTQLTPHIGLNSRLGYTIYSPDRKGTIGLTKRQEGFYFQLSAIHQVNPFISHNLSVGRKSDIGLHLAVTADNLQYYYVNWSADLKFIRNVSLSPNFLYENGSRSGTLNEHFDRLGFGISLGRPITQKLSAGLGYRYFERHSNVPSGRYTDNSIVLSLAYRF